MKLLISLSILTLSLSVFANDVPQSNPTPEITNGYYDISSKQLIVSGPAAESIWNQMEKVEEKPIMIGREQLGKSKESNGTTCEQTRQRPRPLAHTVLVTTCGISLESVGTDSLTLK